MQIPILAHQLRSSWNFFTIYGKYLYGLKQLWHHSCGKLLVWVRVVSREYRRGIKGGSSGWGTIAVERSSFHHCSSNRHNLTVSSSPSRILCPRLWKLFIGASILLPASNNAYGMFVASLHRVAYWTFSHSKPVWLMLTTGQKYFMRMPKFSNMAYSCVDLWAA